MTPKVSLVYAARREGGNVQRTIDSLLATTTEPEWEAIVVDDGHEDNGCEFLLEQPYRDDSRFTLVRLRESQGAAGARHAGALLATGEYLVFCDAHLGYYSDWLTGLVGVLGRYGAGAIVEARLPALKPETWEWETDTPHYALTLKPTMETGSRPLPPSGLTSTIGGGCFGLTREWYFVLGGFDAGMRIWGSECQELSIRNYAFGGRCYIAPEVTVGHLYRAQNPNPVLFADIHYNRLRMAYIHFDSIVFAQVVRANVTEPGSVEGFKYFLAGQQEIEQRRQWVMSRRMVPVDWYQQQFLDWSHRGTE